MGLQRDIPLLLTSPGECIESECAESGKCEQVNVGGGLVVCPVPKVTSTSPPQKTNVGLCRHVMSMPSQKNILLLNILFIIQSWVKLALT